MPLMEEIKKKKKQVQNAIGGTIAQVPKVTVGEVAKTAGRIGKKMAMAGTVAGTASGGANVIRKSLPAMTEHMMVGTWSGGANVTREPIPLLKKKLADEKYEKYEYAKPISKIGVIRRRARM